MPIERMLRRTWLADSSYANISARSPRRHAASAKLAAMLLLPVPGEPETSELLPRKTPWPLSMSSRPAMPVGTRSPEAW